MSAELTWLELRVRRRSTLAYSAGMVAYTLLIVALYPSFRQTTGLDRFTRGSSATVAAVFGASGSLTSPSGWVNSHLYGNFVPLIVLLIAIGYGAQAIAGQSEDGTLGPLLTLPVTRRGVLAQKIAGLVLLVVPVILAIMAGVVIGRAFQISVGLAPLLAISAGSLLLAVDYGLLAMLAGALTGARAAALGVASAAAVVGYVLSSLAPVVGWLHPARYASPFYYATGAGQLDQPRLGYLLVLLALGIVLALGAFAAFARMDVP